MRQNWISLYNETNSWACSAGVDKKGIGDAKVSTGWWERFSRRHPELILRCAAPLSYARAMATDHSVIEKYYDMLEHALRSNGIFDKPGNIFRLGK